MLCAETEGRLVGLADDCLGLVATRSQVCIFPRTAIREHVHTHTSIHSAQVSVPLAACCKRLRPLMLPKLTEMRTSAILRLSMLGHY